MDDTQNLKQILSTILDIVEFQDDKNAFINQFIETVYAAVLVKLVESLPEDKRKQFQTDVNGKLEIENIQTLVKNYFSEQQIFDANKDAVAETITDFLESISPELNDEKRTRLDTYLESVLAPQEK